MYFTALACFTAAATSLALAACAVLREKWSRVACLFAAAVLILALEALLAGLGSLAGDDLRVLSLHRFQMAVASLLPGTWLAFSLVYARGNAVEFVRQWRVILVLAFLLPPACVAAGWKHLVTGIETADGAAVGIRASLGAPGIAAEALLIVGLVMAMMNLERTLLASTGTMRWRVKFVVLGLGLLYAVRVYSAAQHVLYSSVSRTLHGLNAGAQVACGSLMLVGMLRAPLGSADIYPPRNATSHSLTVVLVAVYLLSLGVFARIAVELGAVGGFPLKAFLLLVCIIATAVLALSDRVRQVARRLASAVMRRSRYDYRKVWVAFTTSTAAALTASDFCRAVARLVSETLEALAVTVWIIDEAQGQVRFGGSTALNAAGAAPLLDELGDAGEVVRGLKRADGPVHLDRCSRPWAFALLGLVPAQFGNPEGRLCVPLKSGGELLGVIAMADRVQGADYTAEEMALVRTVADQAAARLLNMRLAERLLAAKQMEAFQTMSAFFVHDLKNTSSTLSLTLQNLPRHFDDAAFREDALKAIAKSVSRIDDLIRRLTALRTRLDIRPVPTNLTDVVRGVAGGLSPALSTPLAADLAALPPLMLDPEQIQKVITNLVLNARDASAPGAPIRVATSTRPGWAVLSVTDQGVGMSPAFVRDSLFRPFKSTKKDGMGIGLFQSKMIVEAHGGKIEIASEEGRGSTFRVLLPLPEV